MLPRFDMRDSFFTALYDIAVKDRDIVILSNDFGAPALDRFRAELPAQFINAAISEQNTVSTAAGMAKSGKKVIIYSIATFVTLRALEQIKVDLCVMNLPVTIVGVGTGYAYSVDGPTHHATEDIALIRALSNMTIISPSDSAMAANLGRNLRSFEGPLYLRLDRGKWPSLYLEEADFSTGLAVIRPGQHVALVATGSMVHRAIEVASGLVAKGVDARVVDLYRLKPLNSTAFEKAVSDVAAVVTMEEHTKNGGVGGLVAEALADGDLLKPLKRIAIADEKLYAYGPRDRLHRDRRLDSESLCSDVMAWLNQRNLVDCPTARGAFSQ